MATIDKLTANAIKENKSRLKILSKERIWAFSGDNTGEFMKAWKQAKNFSEYLELYNQFDLWEDIFPGLEVNTDIKDSKYLEVYLSNILKNNPKSVLDSLVSNLKMEVDWARKIVFLISLLDLNPENITDYYKAKVVSRVSNDIILDWYRVNGIDDKMHLAFLEFSPSVSSQELMSKGYKGKELGDEIKRLEIEKFKSLYEKI